VEFSKKTFNKCTNWVLDHIRSKQEADELIDLFKEKIKHLDTKKNTFELKEGKSALKQFATHYTIDGKAGYNAESFLREVKSHVVDKLERIPKTKVKMVLKCMMERTNIGTGKEETEEACFWSEEPEINLETTDKDDLYEKMSDRIKENKAKFERVEGTG